jgi:hypothetical protein
MIFWYDSLLRNSYRGLFFSHTWAAHVPSNNMNVRCIQKKKTWRLLNDIPLSWRFFFFPVLFYIDFIIILEAHQWYYCNWYILNINLKNLLARVEGLRATQVACVGPFDLQKPPSEVVFGRYWHPLYGAVTRVLEVLLVWY